MPPRTLVVSGTDVLARGFFSIPSDRRAPDGRPTNALFGAVRTLRRALAFKWPDRAIAVVEPGAPPGWPAALVEQIPALPRVLAAHGLQVVEADDPIQLVASYVVAAVDAGDDVVVVGSDKRLGQLVADRVWWYEGHKDVRYTVDAIRKRFGVPPPGVASWLALVGEEGLLPGVPGIGKKGAIGLIETHGSLAAALDHAEAVQGRAGKALRASLQAARDGLRFATLQRDRALPLPLEALAYTPPEAGALNRTYRDLAFFSMLAAERASTDHAVCADPAGVAAALEALGDGPVALHALTEDPSPARGALVGLAASAGPGRAVYFPFAGEGARLEPALLAPWLGDPARPKVGHDVKAAVVALARVGVTVRGVVGDSALASHLANPSGMAPHDLDRVARARLQRALPSEAAVRGVGASQKAWGQLEVARAGAYACHLADVAGALWQTFAPTVPAALLAEHLALCETLVRMELAGMPCDRADLAAAGKDFAAIGAALRDEIHGHAGHAFSVNSTRQLGQVLFEELGLPVLRRTKTGWSTATPALERLVHAHPIVPLVIRWRQLRRLQDTWVKALGRSIGDDGRIHSTFHPARSFSGRLVNSHPDLGRVPGRTPELARIRHAFRARPGWTLLSVDYDQLGLYVLAHLTRDPALEEPLRDGRDIHLATAAAVLDKDPAAIDPDERQLGKVVNFATFAGQGSSALALQLGVTPREAKRLIGRFYERYAVTRAFQEGQLALARERGWVETIAGRRWSIRDLKSHEPRDLAYGERLARRATHEGSVADVTRRGLLRADQALRAAGSEAIPLVQIHDEVLFEVPEAGLHQAATVAARAMRAAFMLAVPLRVGAKAGPSWAELSPLG